jgi:type I restriction enzyme S subunit
VSIEHLITEHLDIWTAADTEKKSGRGRGSANSGNVYGIKKLRELILELAVRGKLVPQDPNDEPASELIKRIQAEKAKLIAEGKIKKSKPLADITDDEKPFELPAGWEWVRLGDTGKIFNGNSINENEKTEKYTKLKSGYPFIATKDVGYGRDKLDYQNGVLIPFDNESFKIAHIGAVLICSEGGSSGKKIGITEMDICFGNKLYANETWLGFVPLFIFYIYQSPYFFKSFSERMTGIIGGISINQFLTIPISIPSESEQHRIVAKVDELMALCDQLENQHNNAAEAHEKLVAHLLGTLTQSQNAEDFNANWQRIAEHFDTLFTTETSIDELKQTLLQLAVMGKLVPQDPNDEPASELLKRIQAEKAKLIAEGKIKKEKPLAPITEEEKPFELPVGWERINFGEIIALVSGQHLNPSEYFDEPKNGSIPYITGPADFGNEGPVPTRHTCERRALSIYGDILVTVKGSGVGKTNSVCQKELAISRQLMAVRPIIVNVNFIEKLLITLAKLFQELTVGIAIPGISREDVLYAVIEIPPIAEQHRIVAKVDELMAICDQLKTRITEANELQRKIADVVVENAI